MGHRLGCSKACGVFPDQGSNLCLLRCQLESLPLSHQRNPLPSFLANSSDSLLLSIPPGPRPVPPLPGAESRAAEEGMGIPGHRHDPSHPSASCHSAGSSLLRIGQGNDRVGKPLTLTCAGLFSLSLETKSSLLCGETEAGGWTWWCHHVSIPLDPAVVPGGEGRAGWWGAGGGHLTSHLRKLPAGRWGMEGGQGRRNVRCSWV